MWLQIEALFLRKNVSVSLFAKWQLSVRKNLICATNVQPPVIWPTNIHNQAAPTHTHTVTESEADTSTSDLQKAISWVSERELEGKKQYICRICYDIAYIVIQSTVYDVTIILNVPWGDFGNIIKAQFLELYIWTHTTASKSRQHISSSETIVKTTSSKLGTQCHLALVSSYSSQYISWINAICSLHKPF